MLDDSQRARWNAQPRWLMQYCHGSPGFVINLADFPGEELDALLLGAGETTWAAGPLKKGSNLCHGTGGNGYAFLKLFERTGDARWLRRARAFAMHGIRQTEAHAAQYGQLRNSLWTGDIGFAVYLWDCIRGAAAFPMLDVFWGRVAPGDHTAPSNIGRPGRCADAGDRPSQARSLPPEWAFDARLVSVASHREGRAAVA